jgi:hypothetical protein
MKINTYLFSFLLLGVLFSCSPDDDGPDGPNLRDRGELEAENRVTIKNFLETHTFTVAADPQNSQYEIITFDSITDPGTQTPIMESDKLKSKDYTQDDVTYKIYYLKINEGAPESYKLTSADRAILSYRTLSIDLELADAVSNSTRANLPGGIQTSPFIRGATEGLNEFRGASSFTENPDGTLSFSDDYGLGAVFIPSGLAYFATGPFNSGIGAYEPIIFSFKVFKSIQADHDDDGIPSSFEDVNDDGFVRTDDTDRDRMPNYLDSDDDGDGILTKDEIEVNDLNDDGIISEGEINFIDSNDDGKPDYLDVNS